MYENSLIYTGSDKDGGRKINKDICKEWSEGYNITTNFGYRYLHPGNILLFKIHNEEKDIYYSLVLHRDGDIECIIENN